MDKDIQQVLTVRKAILEHLQARQAGPYGQGIISCPVCQTGKVAFSRASSNGHVWARCTTEGCVRWME